jgi:hypothetical protein
MNRIETSENFRFVVGNVDPRDATNKRVPAIAAAQDRVLLEGQVAIFQTRSAAWWCWLW